MADRITPFKDTAQNTKLARTWHSMALSTDTDNTPAHQKAYSYLTMPQTTRIAQYVEKGLFAGSPRFGIGP